MIKVLIVEDEPIVRRDLVLLTRWEELGCVCAGEAATGKEGIARFNELQPDIVITDIRMPELDGLEMISIISEICAVTAGSVSAEFIILSGYGDFEYARKAMREGVQEYLLKPVDDDELAAAVRRVIGRITARKGQSGAGVSGDGGKSESMLMLFKEYELGGRESVSARNVEKAIELIRTRYIGGITIEQAAETLGISAGHLSRSFKSETGYTFVDYLTFFRIKKAAELLQDANAKIYEVADMVGYGDARYFSQIFKRLTGLTPKEFQERR
ncbi:response regulator transcription factor [Treponema brennaborense]|uniref:Two component transcriptional regulator, AraC family n=1 Tax=Treponema brennaborense (strain DSM 12168 / CIP 105900 / DD5/3) TaxID=906968 RepID=F4LNW0_TREBD|nr:response regulator [Treponema brennaborense]AEE17937.1 two component transcriptional regulator, AraC family [Treponema brennaborense DSM 12168]